MSTNLYEILKIQNDATPEQIRKAYKKRALETHPDRAPTEDKTQAEEKFRLVNNAYEILIDPAKRQSYDRHGRWPPPTEDLPRYSQHTTRNHPPHPPAFTFTDPFQLFNAFFTDPFSSGRAGSLFSTSLLFPFPGHESFGLFDSGVRMGGSFSHDPFIPPMAGGHLFHSHGISSGGRPLPYFPPTSFHPTDRGIGDRQYISESHSTTIINGLTTSINKRVDSSGNTHTVTTHPDGNRTYTINGVLQPSGLISDPQPPSHTAHPYHHLPAQHHQHLDHHHHRHSHSSGGGPYRYYSHRDSDRGYFPDLRY